MPLQELATALKRAIVWAHSYGWLSKRLTAVLIIALALEAA
jgi:hypothetical protein